MLRHDPGLIPDSFAPEQQVDSEPGMLLGLLCALRAHFLPGVRET